MNSKSSSEKSVRRLIRRSLRRLSAFLLGLASDLNVVSLFILVLFIIVSPLLYVCLCVAFFSLPNSICNGFAFAESLSPPFFYLKIETPLPLSLSLNLFCLFVSYKSENLGFNFFFWSTLEQVVFLSKTTIIWGL